MCDEIILRVVYLLLYLASDVLAFGLGGYAIKRLKIGFILVEHGTEVSTPRELRHFWDFNEQYAIIALATWNAFLLFLVVVVIVSKIGVYVVSQCCSIVVDFMIVQPIVRCLCGDQRKTGRKRKPPDIEMEDLDQVMVM